MEQDKNVESSKTYLLYAITFVVILIILTAALTYAFLSVTTSVSNTDITGDIGAECINLTLSDNNSVLNLSYKYPISDNLALTNGNITPVKISVTNNCSESKKFTLSLSTMKANGDETTTLNEDDEEKSPYIEDSKIRYALASESETPEVKGYLSDVSKLDSNTNAYKELTGNASGALKTKFPDYTYVNIYSLLSNEEINKNETKTYNLYLWVDYYEGDSNMYKTDNDNTPTHNTEYDNSTEGMKFAAAVSLSVDV